MTIYNDAAAQYIHDLFVPDEPVLPQGGASVGQNCRAVKAAMLGVIVGQPQRYAASAGTRASR